MTRCDMPFIVGNPGTFHLISDKKVCGIEPSGGFPAKTVGHGTS